MTPSTLGLPISQWREGQWEAVQNSIKSRKRFVAHNAPTGCGKTWMLLGESRATQQRTLILTGSKALQTQYIKELATLNAIDIRGKSNYTCRATDIGGEFYSGVPATTVDHGPCQYEVECGLKLDGCSYFDRVRQVSTLTNKLVIANYAAWISANMFTEGWGKFPLIMCDEAHEAEEWLARMLAIRFPWTYDKALESGIPVETDPLVWQMWANDTLPSIRQRIRDTKKSGRMTQRQISAMLSLKSIEKILSRVREVNEDWMVLKDREGVLLHPVWVHKYAEEYLFKGADKVVFASATMRPHTLRLLGVDDGHYDFFEYPSTFPVERRPIYYYPVVKMHYGMDAEETTQWVDAVDGFISRRLDRKGVIHTVSYARQKQLLEHSRFASLMVANSSTATTMATLQKFRAMSPPAILVSPSLSTGISLDGRQCEYTIIPKIPFESITDPLNMARAAEDPNYGIYQAAQTLIQSIGRAMRSAKDQNETLITDSVFGMFYNGSYRKMLPNWIWDAVQRVESLPAPLEGLAA